MSTPRPKSSRSGTLRPIHLLRRHHQPLRPRQNSVNRPTSHQRQPPNTAVLSWPCIPVRPHGPRNHTVVNASLVSFQPQPVALAQAAEKTKISVAMSRDQAIAGCVGRSRPVDVSRPEGQRRTAGAGQDRVLDAQPWDTESSDGMRVRPTPRKVGPPVMQVSRVRSRDSMLGNARLDREVTLLAEQSRRRGKAQATTSDGETPLHALRRRPRRPRKPAAANSRASVRLSGSSVPVRGSACVATPSVSSPA